MEKAIITADQLNRFMGIYERNDDAELYEFVFLGDIDDVFKYRSYINSMIEKTENQIKAIDFAVNTFIVMQIGYNEGDVDESKNELSASINEYNEHLKKVKDLIRKRQDKCQHDWHVVGNTSHQDLERCSKCGKDIWI